MSLQYPSIETLGLPEFGTEYERDPYNLKFLSERLDICKCQHQSK